MKNTLIYVHDPMCSWCWGFEPVRKQFFEAVSGKMTIRRLVGGLAADSMEPMPESMQLFLQQTWKKIEQTIPNTSFNFDFWTECSPRRSTYPSNRAVIAAKLQGEQYDEAMTLRIQQAYYKEARNPSDNTTLIELAEDIGLEVKRFKSDITTDIVEQMLVEEIRFTRKLGMNSFPSLSLARNDLITPIQLDYNNVDIMLDQINSI